MLLLSGYGVSSVAIASPLSWHKVAMTGLRSEQGLTNSKISTASTYGDRPHAHYSVRCNGIDTVKAHLLLSRRAAVYLYFMDNCRTWTGRAFLNKPVIFM